MEKKRKEAAEKLWRLVNGDMKNNEIKICVDYEKCRKNKGEGYDS